MKMDMPGETNVKVYTSLGEKVDLLIERMSECVRLAQEYMKERTAERRGDRLSLGEMLRDFPPCIQALRENQEELKKAVLTLIPLRSARVTILRSACSMITTFYQNNHGHRRDICPLVRNEMRNLIRFVQNLYPQQWVVGGFTRLHLNQGPLIKWLRQDTQEVVVVSELAWKTECVVCLAQVREVVMYPCTHCCLCRECKDIVHNCPICRSPVRQVVHTDDADRERRPYIMSTQFQGSEGDMSSLFRRLQPMGDVHTMFRIDI
jgi:hypothetical protein